MELTIYERYFYNADCFKNAIRQTPVGVQVHSTGCDNPFLRRYVQPDDGRIGVNTCHNSHNRPGLTTCASAYIGRQSDGTVAVYQTLPWDYRCWLSGSGEKGNANRLGYIGFEILQDDGTDEAYFHRAVMEQAAALCAHLCLEHHLSAASVQDHAELSKLGLASDHADISHWLRRYGLSMADFRQQVQNYMKEGVHVTYIACEASLYTARCVCPGAWLNLRAAADKNSPCLKRIPRGNDVEVLQEVNAVWCRARVEGVSGFCMKEYLAPDMLSLSLKRETAEALQAALKEALQ